MQNSGLSKKTRHLFGEAVSHFKMIQEDDHILVGFSGGKDSTLLLFALKELQEKSPIHFNLTASMILPTQNEIDLTPWQRMAEKLDIPLDIVRHPIFKIIEDRSERSPCSLCAHLRRGILASRAKELGCNVLALGHHKDDVVETVFLNLFYTGRFKAFHPHLEMSRSEIRVIRPMVYIAEGRVIAEAERLQFPILEVSCPYSCDSKRARIKEIVNTLSHEFPDMKSNTLHALSYIDPADIWNI